MATKLATHIFLFAISVAMLSCNISAATFPTGLVDVGPYLAQIEQYLPEPFDEGNVVAEECTFNMSLGWVNCTYINTDVTVVPGFDALPPWQIGDNTYKIYMRFNDSAQNVRRADATFSTIKDEPGWISACVKIISSFTVCTAKEYDMLGPVFASCPSYFGIEAINSSGATVTYPTPAATDKIGVFGDVNCTPASGSIFAVGNTPTSCSAIDFFGFSGSCSFSISVVDTTAPSITILGNNPATVKEKSAYTDSGATATDLVDGPVTVTKTGSVNTNVIGTYTITYTAKDAHENTATATRTVNVVDGTAPVIAAHANVVAEATSAGGAIVSYTPPIASDAVDGNLPADCTPASGSQFAIGATTITCTKTDAAGNVATPKTFKVTVKDTTKPVIAAHNDELAEATSADGAIVSYTPPIASDAVDGDLPADCAPASGSQFALGATTITCTKTDSHGNAAKPVKFAVTVEHKAPPVIRPHDAVAIEATSSAGAIATYAAPIAVDAVDGELIASCSPVSGAQFAFGDTTVTCTKSDSAGNAAIPTSFKVTVSDTTKPVITLLGFNPETIQVKSIYADLGATAIDAVDGAISVTSSGLVNTNALGSNTITYSASDSHGNTATATRTVNVVDTTAPTITLVGENPVEIEVGSAYADAGAIAIDNYDGTITSSIVTVNPVNTSAVGTYSVTYDVSDSSGNHAAQVTRTVNVVDTTAPIITILGSNPATVEAKTAYADAGATALDAVDGMVPVVASGTVNTDVLGEYTITYTATDESGNTATATRTVNVVDTTAPSITILGSNPDFSEVNTEYADAGATAFDAVDGIAIVVATGSVNINAIGSNTITYTASDSHGNTATATRVVNVVDTTAPSITLVGETPIIIEVGLAYFDAGATAVDNYDGIITSRIVAVNSVNTSVVGTYTVTYDVEDSSDNHAAQVARTVNVIDTTAPVISLLGENPITI
ncbi:MAG: immunoglobulin-like domain-containing protein, partial [Candidatus Micrarchaeia archaeon]